MFLWDYDIDTDLAKMDRETKIVKQLRTRILVAHFKEVRQQTRFFLAINQENTVEKWRKLIDADAILYALLEAIYLGVVFEDLADYSIEETLNNIQRYYRQDYFSLDRQQFPFDNDRLFVQYLKSTAPNFPILTKLEQSDGKYMLS